MKSTKPLSITDLNVGDKIHLKQWVEFRKEYYEYKIRVNEILSGKHISGSFSFKNDKDVFEKYPSDFICAIGPKDIIIKI